MIGRILGNRYEILEEIGEGGMAKVYKAKCHLLNRIVAIKILRPEFAADEDFVKNWARGRHLLYCNGIYKWTHFKKTHK
jgi:serine/threonine-protein kinase